MSVKYIDISPIIKGIKEVLVVAEDEAFTLDYFAKRFNVDRKIMKYCFEELEEAEIALVCRDSKEQVISLNNLFAPECLAPREGVEPLVDIPLYQDEKEDLHTLH